MGIIYVDGIIENITNKKSVEVKKLMVDTGAEYTWVSEKDLKKASVSVRKRDIPFIIANGQVITSGL